MSSGRGLQEEIELSLEVERLRPTNVEDMVEGAALLASSFPVIGGVASGIALHTTASRRWDRLVNFLISVEEKLQEVESISDDQEEIVVEVLERVVKERSEEKRECFRNILVHAIVDQDLDYDTTIENVRLLERLTSNHIRMLSILRDPLGADRQLGGKVAAATSNSFGGSYAAYLRPFFDNWNDEQLRRVWSDLHNEYVLNQSFPTTVGVSPNLEGLTTCLSDYGMSFVQHILSGPHESQIS